jgi:L,D-transpeptidase catalytic domain
MRMSHCIATLTAATVALFALGQAALADLMINIDKSTQRMTVTVDGKQIYNWPVSTGGLGYDTPSGTFRPFRMEIDHYSDEYDSAPMPYSIFFTKTGVAVHGTYEQRNLGRAVSHGCVRLSVKNAATLWELVKGEKMANATVVLSGTTSGGGSSAVARSRPLPPNADDPRSGTPMPLTADSTNYGAPLTQYQPRNDDRPLLPFPFLFGR